MYTRIYVGCAIGVKATSIVINIYVDRHPMWQFSNQFRKQLLNLADTSSLALITGLVSGGQQAIRQASKVHAFNVSDACFI